MMLYFKCRSKKDINSIKKKIVDEDKNLMPITFLGKLRSVSEIVEVIGLDTQKISIKQISNSVCQQMYLDEVNYAKKHWEFFKKLHECFGLDYKKYVNRLKTGKNGDIQVDTLDVEFIYNLLLFREKRDRPYIHNGLVNDKNAETQLWKAEGLYLIYAHAGLNEEELQEISNKINRRGDYLYWKQRKLYLKTNKEEK